MALSKAFQISECDYSNYIYFWTNTILKKVIGDFPIELFS
jgi:hypothetical protein